MSAIISRKFSDHLVFSGKSLPVSISFRLFHQISVCVFIQNCVQFFAFGVSFNLIETSIKIIEIQFKTLLFYLSLHAVSKLLTISWSIIKQRSVVNVSQNKTMIENEFNHSWKLQYKNEISVVEFNELIYLFVTLSAIVIFIHQMHFCDDVHVYRDVYRGSKGDQADRLTYIFSLMMTILPFPL